MSVVSAGAPSSAYLQIQDVVKDFSGHLAVNHVSLDIAKGEIFALLGSSGYINDMANGSVCLALGWSGDINIARQRAIDGKTGQNIQALIPKTGGLLFFDVMVIPADAAHPGNAHKFINYMLRPEVSAGLTNKVFYANPNTESRKFIKPEVASNPTVFLAPQDMARMIAPDSLNNDLRRLMTRTFTTFKTGL